jgi:hypothetical protein
LLSSEVGGVNACAGSGCLDRFEASGKAASEETFEGSVARVGKGIDGSMVVAGQSYTATFSKATNSKGEAVRRWLRESAACLDPGGQHGKRQQMAAKRRERQSWVDCSRASRQSGE